MIKKKSQPRVKSSGIIMTKKNPEDMCKLPAFGRRKVACRACVVDGKPHVRKFLRETLDESDSSPASALTWDNVQNLSLFQD
jgi:hypothetical protein